MTSTDCHTSSKSNPSDQRSKALKIFHKASEKLPKYAETIKRISGLTPKEIKTFGQIPIVTKQDYFKDRTLEDLCVDPASLDTALLISSSGESDIFSFG